MTASATMSKVDADRFAKVRKLMEGGATEGERAAARKAAARIARRAGLTVEQAMSKMDTKPKTASKGWFGEFEDAMEAKQPGWKAERAARDADRARRYADRRAEMLRKHGSAEGVFLLTPIELALYAAATPFAERKHHPNWVGERTFAFTIKLAGCGEWGFRGRAPAAAVEAIRSAWPMPDTMSGLLAEAKMWDELWRDRQAFVVELSGLAEYHHHREVEARNELIEHELDTRPVASWDDMAARFDWEHFKVVRGFLDPGDAKEKEIDVRLREDFEILRGLYERDPDEKGPHNLRTPREDAPHRGAQGRRTNADKANDVVSMLDANPDLPDREIARRCGVSPQTVGNWRRRRGGNGAVAG